MLDVRSLEKAYGNKQAVRGISFAVEKGTVLGFLGPNGAGKSTTMRMIAGVLEPDVGDVLIDGKSIISERRAAQAALGYLPEGAPLYNDMTPPEFLAFLASARQIPKAQRKDAIERTIADARISGVLGQRIGALSKGYRRRVGLAGAILHDPPVLVLDEPTDGLDPNQKRAVRALIAQMAPTKAIIISTHTLTEVPAMCHRAVLVSRGRIVADDTPEGLAKRTDDGTLESAFARLTDQVEEETL